MLRCQRLLALVAGARRPDRAGDERRQRRPPRSARAPLSRSPSVESLNSDLSSIATAFIARAGEVPAAVATAGVRRIGAPAEGARVAAAFTTATAREALAVWIAGAWAAGAPVDIWVFADDRWYASDPDGPHTGSERRASAQEPVTTRAFDALLDHADKITFVSDDEAALRALYAEVHAAIGERATVAQSQTYYLDVTAQRANKGDGIAALAAALHVDLADVAAIGDQANDLPMLKRAGLSIAMGNAPETVQSAAAVTTRANTEDGVAHAIDTIVLPRRN